MNAPSRSLVDRIADSSCGHLCSLSPAREEEVRQVADKLGFRLWEVKLAPAFTIESIIESFGKALNFPEPYGRNWNAMIDCLRYLPDSKGHIVLVDSIDSLWKEDPILYYKLTHILKDLGEEFHSWKGGRITFKALLLTENKELERVIGCRV